jgi:hypothetical protein
VEVASVPGEGTPEPTGEGQSPEATPQTPEWQGPIDELGNRLGEVSDGMRQLMSRIPEQQAEPEPDFGQQLESLYDDSGFADPAAIQQLIQQQVQSGVQQAMAPLAQQFQEMRQGMTAEKLDALQSRYPDLQDPQKAAEVVDDVVTRAQAWGNPELANNPEFVEMVHLSRLGRAMPQETPAGQGPEAHLESGGGGGPAEPEADPFDAIIAKGRRPSVF